MHQDRLGLVISVMSDGDMGGAGGSGGGRQERIPHLAGRLFECEPVLRRITPHVLRRDVTGNPRTGQVLRQLGVRVGLGPTQAVVEMCDVEAQTHAAVRARSSTWSRQRESAPPDTPTTSAAPGANSWWRATYRATRAAS